MAYANILNRVEGYIAGADLSAEQYTFVKVAADGDVEQANAGETAIGVLWNDPASGRAASVVTGGQPHVYTGAAVAVGADVASDNEGRAVTATTGDEVLGRAMTAAGGANELITIDFYAKGQFTAS